MAYQPNPGRLPADCELLDEHGELAGYRPVHVRLFCGWDSQRAGHAPWPAAGGRPRATVWRISTPPHPFEIQQYEVA